MLFSNEIFCFIELSVSLLPTIHSGYGTSTSTPLFLLTSLISTSGLIAIAFSESTVRLSRNDDSSSVFRLTFFFVAQYYMGKN